MDCDQASRALINIVRGFEMLYNPTHYGYKDPDSKREGWEKVAEKLSTLLDKHVGVKDAKNRWGNLRDRYKRLRKSGKETTWKHYSAMRFLDTPQSGRVTKTKTKQSTRQQAKKEKLEEEAALQASQAAEAAQAIQEAEAAVQTAQETFVEEQLSLQTLQNGFLQQNGVAEQQRARLEEMGSAVSAEGDSYFFCMDLCRSLDQLPPEARRRKKIQLFQVMYND